MGNHGPWLAKGPPIDPDIAALFDPAAIPGGAGLVRYLDGLRRSDEMLRLLIGGLERRGGPAVVAFTATTCRACRMPSPISALPKRRADYVIWNGSGAAKRRDIFRRAGSGRP